jgi:hypothetical protein
LSRTKYQDVKKKGAVVLVILINQAPLTASMYLKKLDFVIIFLNGSVGSEP